MQRHKVDSGIERRILIGLVTSAPFLGQVEPALGDLKVIDSELFTTVAKWCLDYFREYNKPPGKHIEDLYHTWSGENKDSDLVDSVKGFLETLSDEYEAAAELNVPYLLDQVRDLLRKNKLKTLARDLEYDLTRGELVAAEEAVVAYQKVDALTSPGCDTLNDDKVLERTFQDVYSPLITLQDDLGLFFNHALTRDAFVGFQAGEKSGKTYLEIQVMLWALMQRRKVAVFEVGDLSESQIMLRLYGLWAGMPTREDLCGEIFVPTRIKFDDVLDTGYTLKGRTVYSPRVCTQADGKAGREAFKRAHGISSKKPYLMTSVHPSSSINVRGISSILDQWEQSRGFVPDVIIVDYADILAPEDPKKEARHQVNDTWKALRALSQERRALVITATQSNADVYKQGESQRLQTQGNFSEDKRKYAHVTAMLGINRTWDEAAFGGMRLNWLVVREAPFNVKRPLYVGSCLALGRSICCAAFKEIRKNDT